MARDRRRVVITGMGVIAPNGLDLETFWDSIVNGVSGAGYVTRFDTSRIPAKVAAEVKDFDPTLYMGAKTARRLERSLQFSVAAARLAATDAALDFGKLNANRAGVIEGTCMSNMEAAFHGKDDYRKRGYRSVSPSVMINAFVGGGSGEVAEKLGLKAHAISYSTSSASGSDVIGYGADLIIADHVDIVVAGGAEAPIIEEIYGGFYLSKAMTSYVDNPKRAMRPFDRSRNGFVLGEGAGFVVLEELTHALTRGSKIYAEVVGHGRSCEAYHPIAPEPSGEGAVRAIEKALRRAELDITEVEYINAHGSATEVGDLAETRAIKHVFREHAKKVSVSSTKPVTGHSMAAAGALETVSCALALYHRKIPMTLNHSEPAEECDLDYVSGASRPYPLRVALNLNNGFGGKNSCLALKRFPDTET